MSEDEEEEEEKEEEEEEKKEGEILYLQLIKTFTGSSPIGGVAALRSCRSRRRGR